MDREIMKFLLQLKDDYNILDKSFDMMGIDFATSDAANHLSHIGKYIRKYAVEYLQEIIVQDSYGEDVSGSFVISETNELDIEEKVQILLGYKAIDASKLHELASNLK